MLSGVHGTKDGRPRGRKGASASPESEVESSESESVKRKKDANLKADKFKMV